MMASHAGDVDALDGLLCAYCDLDVRERYPVPDSCLGPDDGQRIAAEWRDHESPIDIALAARQFGTLRRLLHAGCMPSCVALGRLVGQGDAAHGGANLTLFHKLVAQDAIGVHAPLLLQMSSGNGVWSSKYSVALVEMRPDLVRDPGNNMMSRACIHQDEALVRAILAVGGRADHQDLSMAVTRSSRVIVDLLLASGVCVHHRETRTRFEYIKHKHVPRVLAAACDPILTAHHLQRLNAGKHFLGARTEKACALKARTLRKAFARTLSGVHAEVHATLEAGMTSGVRHKFMGIYAHLPTELRLMISGEVTRQSCVAMAEASLHDADAVKMRALYANVERYRQAAHMAAGEHPWIDGDRLFLSQTRLRVHNCISALVAYSSEQGLQWERAAREGRRIFPRLAMFAPLAYEEALASIMSVPFKAASNAAIVAYSNALSNK
jgi:hypothetical protein